MRDCNRESSGAYKADNCERDLTVDWIAKFVNRDGAQCLRFQQGNDAVLPVDLRCDLIARKAGKRTTMASLELLESYLKQDPDNLELLARAVDTAISCQKADRALAHADRALALAPGHVQFSYRRAVALRRLDRIEEASSELEDLALADNAHVVPLYELAELRFQQGRYEAALEVIDRVLAAPAYADVVPGADLLHARCLHFLGRLEEAIAHLESLLDRAPNRLDLSGPLATLYLDAGRMQDATRLYAQAASAGRLTPELHCVGGFVALQAEDIPLALDRFSNALSARSDDGRAHLGAGLAAAAGQDLDTAAMHLQRAVAAMPTHLGTLNALAWIQILRGEVDAAESTLSNANAVDRSFGETYGGLAVIAALRRDGQRARELIRTALRLDRNSYSAAYASLLLKHGTERGDVAVNEALQFLAKQQPAGAEDLRTIAQRYLARAKSRVGK